MAPPHADILLILFLTIPESAPVPIEVNSYILCLAESLSGINLWSEEYAFIVVKEELSAWRKTARRRNGNAFKP